MGPLAPYRVLDLTTRRGWLCGKMLADLGADVIRVDPPGFDVEPDDTDWLFFNRGKRSVTLPLEDVKRLLDKADVLIESFDPGFMHSRGLGYEALSGQHPRLVYTSITPFGQRGPHAQFQAPDIVLGALGGQVWLTGDPDRPPLRISVPQYELHGAAEAAVHTTIAVFHAASTGEGQHVDVAAQLAIIRTLMNAVNYPVLEGREITRSGGARASSAVGIRMIYRCKDGHITSMLGGPMGTRQLAQWMDEEGDAPDWMREFDWENTDFGALARSEEGPAFYRKVAEALEQFFAKHSKAELYEGALKRRLLIAPVNTVADIRHDEQLASRGYFEEVDGVPYAGAWAKLNATPIGGTRRAPRPGEHTAEVLAEYVS